MHRRQFIKAAFGSSAVVIVSQASGVSPFPSRAAAQNGDQQRMVAVDRLNLRPGAGTSYQLIRAYSRGTTATVTGNGTQANGYLWVPVRVSDGANGWFASGFLGS